MMVIPLVACGEAWFRLRQPAALAGFVALGMTLWLPPALVDHSVLVQLVHVIVWIAVAVGMLILEARLQFETHCTARTEMLANTDKFERLRTKASHFYSSNQGLSDKPQA